MSLQLLNYWDQVSDVTEVWFADSIFKELADSRLIT